MQSRIQRNHGCWEILYMGTVSYMWISTVRRATPAPSGPSSLSCIAITYCFTKKNIQEIIFLASHSFAAAAAKSLQSCQTLCDPIDGSPLGSSIHGIFQARVLEWVAIAFSKFLLRELKTDTFSKLCQNCSWGLLLPWCPVSQWNTLPNTRVSVLRLPLQSSFVGKNQILYIHFSFTKGTLFHQRDKDSECFWPLPAASLSIKKKKKKKDPALWNMAECECELEKACQQQFSLKYCSLVESVVPCQK